MYRILNKRKLAPEVHEYVIEAPEIARAARPGQFVVLRLHERGERIPLTIADADPETGGVTIVVQEVGKTTREMGDKFDKGDCILDFVGPLGKPSEIENFGTVICIGGGLGIAPVYPITRALRMPAIRCSGSSGRAPKTSCSTSTRWKRSAMSSS